MNKCLTHDLHQLKIFCAENGIENFRAKMLKSVWQQISTI